MMEEHNIIGGSGSAAAEVLVTKENISANDCSKAKRRDNKNFFYK